MSYVLALDQGTTSSRAILFDRSGSIAGIAQKEFRQHFPRPGWVEHDAGEIWATQVGVATEVLESVGASVPDIAAIGITNQRETALVWDRDSGRPVYHAIVWQDRRTAEICDRLKAEGHEPLFRERTGLVLDSYFSGTKVKWLLDNVEDVRERAEAGRLAFGTMDSWLVWNLTGGERHITDVTNASRTLMYDIHRGEWDDVLLEILGVPRALLPEVRPSSEVYAETADGAAGAGASGAAGATGVAGTAAVPGDSVPAGIPIAGIAGDQQAALFGQVCTEPGMVKNTYGTGCFMLMNTGTEAVPSEHQLLTTVALERDARTEYALEGSIFIAGAVVQWLRDGLGIIDASSEVESVARQVDDNGGVYFVPALVGLGAPHWDPYARGTIVGLTRGATRAHIARAALESIAYQTADIIHAMESDSGIELTELRVDGGATANDLLMQFQADLLGVPVVRPAVTETTALGAAYLAGLAVDFWKDTEEIAGQWRVDRTFEPSMDRDQVAELMGEWRRAVERSKGWATE